MNMNTIKTEYIYPPIPSRSFDWVAYIDGQEQPAHAYGHTEAEAIENLKEQLEEDGN